MKKSNGILLACLLAVITTMSSCEVLGTAFKITFWSGAIFVIVLIAIIYWIVRKVKK